MTAIKLALYPYSQKLQLTKAYQLAPSHPGQEYSKHTPRSHRHPASACESNPLPRATPSSAHSLPLPNHPQTYLLSLTLPPLLPLMRPAIPKRRFPRLHHPRTHRVLHMHITHSCLNTRCDRPSAARRQLQMLLKRVVALFPPAYRFPAKEALYIVGVLVGWEEEESCSRKL